MSPPVSLTSVAFGKLAVSTSDPLWMDLACLHEKNPREAILKSGGGLRSGPKVCSFLEVSGLCGHRQSEGISQVKARGSAQSRGPSGWLLAFPAARQIRAKGLSLTHSCVGFVQMPAATGTSQTLAPTELSSCCLDKGDAAIRICHSEADLRDQTGGPGRSSGLLDRASYEDSEAGCPPPGVTSCHEHGFRVRLPGGSGVQGYGGEASPPPPTRQMQTKSHLKGEQQCA